MPDAPASAPVVVPTDFSPAAAEAGRYARRLAAATGAPLHLLHVLPWPDAGPFEADDLPGETAAQEEAAEADRALDALGRWAEGAGLAGAVVAVGRASAPAPEIARYAGEVMAGLVVVGTCGQRPRPDALGAVSGELVHTAPCDVLLVPHRAEAPYADGPPRRVLVPVDFSDASRPLLRVGLDVADALGAEGVDAVHVLEPLPHPLRWIDEVVLDLAPEVRQRAGVALRALVDAEAGGAAVELYVERGKPARAIPRVAEALGDDLIVLGPHAERPVFDRLLGSVAEGVARRARCPVLVARRSAAPDAEADDGVDPASYTPETAA